MINYTFWSDVETNLRYVLYGDSVSENSKMVINFKNKIKYLSLTQIWELLISNGYKFQVIENKEYIFLDEHVNILTYNIVSDKIILSSPSYIMRHHFDGDLIRLNLTNYTYIDITQNHSLIGYNKWKLQKILPTEANYVAVCRNELNIQSFKYDLNWLLFGLWISNGTLCKGIGYQYPGFSFTKKEDTVDFIMEVDSGGSIDKIYDKTEHDIYINYKYFQEFLIENGYQNLNSPDREIFPSVFGNLIEDQNAFLSFIIGYYIGDGAYSTNLINFSTASEKLANNIVELFSYYGIYSHILIDKNGRSYNGIIKGDMYFIKVVGMPTTLLNLLKSVENLKNHQPIEEHGLFFGRSESKLNNGSIVRLKRKADILNIKPVKIQSKEFIKYNGYVYDFEVPDTHNFIINGVLVHNTDSLFIYIPSVDNKNINSSIEKSTEVATDVNNLIKNFLDTTLLPKMHVDPKYNSTVFKNEFTCNSIMFLGIKKNYAYCMTSKEGKIYNPGKIQYKGIPVVKSNTSEFVREFLVDLINEIVLNNELDKNDMSAKLHELVKQKNERLFEELEKGNFKYIATPVKWGDNDYAKDTSTIISMKLYNSISGKDVFKPLSSGLYIPIFIKNPIKLKKIDLTTKWGINHSHLNTLNFISLPYNYDSNEVVELFKEYNIEIVSNIWEKATEASIIQKIINLIKDHAKKKK